MAELEQFIRIQDGRRQEPGVTSGNPDKEHENGVPVATDLAATKREKRERPTGDLNTKATRKRPEGRSFEPSGGDPFEAQVGSEPSVENDRLR